MTIVPKPRLRHLGLYTGDMDAMVAFYTDVMGLTVTDRGTFGDPPSRIVFMSSDPGEHHEFVLIDAPADQDAAAFAQQISFLLGSLDEQRALYERVVASGCDVDRMVTHGNAWSFYFNDPEGNRIEIYVHTPWHVPQAHAHPFDLTLSNEEIMAMTESHCRMDAGFMPAAERKAMMAAKMGV
jgi:catechol 2,3-dioxygenase